MSSLRQHPPASHPEDGLLLGYLDGELSGRKTRQVKQHLEACWHCRSEVEALQNTVAECVKYRQNVLAAHLPAPPQPWGDLYGGFAEIDREFAEQSWLRRLARSMTTARTLRWAASAAAILVIAFGLYDHFRETPSVEAAALLQRAVAIEASHPAARRRLSIRTRTAQFTRVAGERGLTHRAPLNRASAAPAIEAMFVAARYDWDEPLTARAYSMWRDSVASKKDRVETVGGEYRVHTEAPGAELASASLTMRTTDLHPVAGRFEFSNHEWVEITELAETTTRSDGVPVETNVESPVRGAVPSRPPVSLPGKSASILEELQVLVALHEIGADLGDPLEISRSTNQVLVSGVGIAPRRQAEIHRALDPLPHVSIRFTEPEPAAAVADDGALSAPAAPNVRQSAMQKRLEQQLGGRADFEKFSGQLLNWSEAAMAQAYALRALAQRFPAAGSAAMKDGDREVLRALARKHTEILTQDTANLQHALAPVLAALGGAPAQGRPVTADAWQSAAEDVFRAGRRVDVLLSVMLGVTQSDNAGDRLPSDLLAAMDELRTSLDAANKLLM